jgi:hypothetical protein
MYRENDIVGFTLSSEAEYRFNLLIQKLKSSLEYLVIVLAVALSFIGWRYYFDQGLILSYNDSMSHLDISRRVVEGLKPGLAQIGSVWLPLPHLLMLPFVWNDFLWHSGLAGTIVSSLSFVGASYFIFKLAKALTHDPVSAFLSALVFILNPNMAYMQSIPMTESLLIFLFIASCYYLFLWQKLDSYKYLALTGFFTLLGTLTRYDGWMLLAQMAIVVLLVAFQKGGYKKAEGNFILFCTIALYGVLLWFVWNLLIFNDPLYFVTGPFSARAQQMVFEAEGRLFSKGHLLYSAFVYSLTIIRNNGTVLTFIGLIGALVYFLKNKINAETLTLSLLLSPLIFNISALYFGHSIINLPDIPPYTLFNVRYGLMMLPAIAVFIGYLARNQRIIQLLILIVLIGQTVLMYKGGDVITVKDGISGASAQGMSETGKWLEENAKSGLILIAASSQDSLIFQSGFPLKRFIHEGTGDYWKESLETPTKYANYVAMHHGDLVYRKLYDNTDFLNNYKKVYDGEFTDIFERSKGLKTPLTIENLP